MLVETAPFLAAFASNVCRDRPRLAEVDLCGVNSWLMTEEPHRSKSGSWHEIRPVNKSGVFVPRRDHAKPALRKLLRQPMLGNSAIYSPPCIHEAIQHASADIVPHAPCIFPYVHPDIV